METKKLTEKQKLFCIEYLKDLNGAQAAIRAGYSEKAARNIACENLTKPYIQEYIKEQNKKRLENAKIDAAWVLEQAKKSYEVNAELIFDDNGNALMTNANAAKGFLELVGKHKDIKAFEDSNNNNQTPTFNINFPDAGK